MTVAASEYNTRIIAITGGIGSGKSEAGRYLTSLGGTLIDADHLVHELLADPNSTITRKIAETFGSHLLTKDGIDREALGKIVFGNAESRKTLEAFVHPAVRTRMAQKIQSLHGTVPWLALEVPLLFESGLNRMFAESWLVVSTKALRIQRVQHRDNLDEKAILTRMDAQGLDEQKIPFATHVLHNNGSKEDLYRQIDRLLVPT